MTRSICSVKECDRPATSGGFCHMHYKRWKRNGDPVLPKPKPEKPLCSVEDCLEQATARGWCGKHYQRWRTKGSPRSLIQKVPEKTRFFRKIQFVDKWHERDGVRTRCLEWVGWRSKFGYGVFDRAYGSEQRKIAAHRWLYKRWIGPIAEGLELDHLCRNPACVNPHHLEAVTHKENVLRGTGVSRRNAEKTECPHGHPYAGENLMRTSRGRVCRTCKRQWERRRAARNLVNGDMDNE